MNVNRNVNRIKSPESLLKVNQQKKSKKDADLMLERSNTRLKNEFVHKLTKKDLTSLITTDIKNLILNINNKFIYIYKHTNTFIYV